jgi:hypothetical protein
MSQSIARIAFSLAAPYEAIAIPSLVEREGPLLRRAGSPVRARHDITPPDSERQLIGKLGDDGVRLVVAGQRPSSPAVAAVLPRLVCR